MEKKQTEMPGWMRELLRQAPLRSQLFVYGAINDTHFYPLPAEDPDSSAANAPEPQWTSGDMRSALFDIARQWLPGYSVIASYSFIEGMHFADEQEEQKMATELAELLKTQRTSPASALGDVPHALKIEDPLDQSLQRIRDALLNSAKPCLIIIEHASQLCASPTALQQPERLGFLRLLLSAQQSPAIPVATDTGTKMVNNLLILLCGKLTDLPPWLYLNNPYSGVIEVAAPRGIERQRFFETQCGPLAERWDSAQMADLTEGMSYRDLIGVRSIAADSQGKIDAKALIDQFKYGDRESEWDSLEYERLAHAEEVLSKRVIGQPYAVASVADVLRRAKLGLSGAQHSSHSKPRGVLFFAGPTGVGKTELAKAVAQLVFNNEEALMRFDMSEYSQSHSDQRLLGAPPGYVGYEEGGQLTQQLLANPFRVLLFDEIEKAHPSILDKFLQILEDGRLTDGRGQTVYFSESIIIFTSNAGIYQLDQQTGRPALDPVTGQALLNVDPRIHTDFEEVRTRVQDGVRAYFKHYLGRPELLNRIGQNIIVFDFVRPPVMRQILERKVLQSIRQQVLSTHGIDVQFGPKVADQLLELLGEDVTQGGRGVGNLAELVILNPLARELYRFLEEHKDLTGRTLDVLAITLPTPEVMQYGLSCQLR